MPLLCLKSLSDILDILEIPFDILRKLSVFWFSSPLISICMLYSNNTKNTYSFLDVSCCVLLHTSTFWSIVCPHFLGCSSTPVFLALSLKTLLTFILKDIVDYSFFVVAHGFLLKTFLITPHFFTILFIFSSCWRAVLQHIFHFCITNTYHYLEHGDEGVMFKNICYINRIWP